MHQHVQLLRGVDDAVQPVCADLGAVLDRFAGYSPRLSNAIDRVEAGLRVTPTALGDLSGAIGASLLAEASAR